MGSCSGCPKTWTGLKISHCGRCHETFSVIQHFDSHRVPLRLKGNSHSGSMNKCLSPDKVKKPQVLKLNATGVWVGNHERPEELDG